LSTLLRLAGNAHRRINSSQWQQVHERLTALDVQRLDELLTPSADSQDSPSSICSGTGGAARCHRQTQRMDLIRLLSDACTAFSGGVRASASNRLRWDQNASLANGCQ
jgi:hypothetical protein